MPLLVNSTNTMMTVSVSDRSACQASSGETLPQYMKGLNCSSWCFQPNGATAQTITLDMAAVYYVYQVHIAGNVQDFTTGLKHKGRRLDNWKTMPTGTWSTNTMVGIVIDAAPSSVDVVV